MANLWFFTVLMLAVGLHLTRGHSWLDCVKDVGNGLRTGDADCRGYPRGYPGRLPGVNIDQIMTYRIQPRVMGENPPICAAGQRSQTAYSSRFYRATAKPGETLRMRWTPNGHQRGAGQTPLTYSIHWTGVAGTQLNNRLDLNTGNRLAGPFPFDETCYCNNCAGDPCYGKFTIPANTKPGVYSFIWYWVFNRDASSGGEEYTTCFDVEVTGTSNNAATSAVRTSAVRTSAARTSSARTSAARTSNGEEETTEETDLTVETTHFDVNNSTAGLADLANTGNTLVGSLSLCFGLFVLLTVTLF
jgi:hypothetical protein